MCRNCRTRSYGLLADVLANEPHRPTGHNATRALAACAVLATLAGAFANLDDSPEVTDADEQRIREALAPATTEALADAVELRDMLVSSLETEVATMRSALQERALEGDQHAMSFLLAKALGTSNVGVAIAGPGAPGLAPFMRPMSAAGNGSGLGPH